MAPGWILSGVMSVASLLAVQAVEAQPSGCDSLVGIWDYVDPSPAGRAIIARLGNKYTLVYFQTARPAAVPAGSAVGRNFFGGVHEYTCEGSSGKYRLKMRALHSHRPEDVGPEVVLDMEVQGDRSKWWFIEPDGKRINPGAASRVK